MTSKFEIAPAGLVFDMDGTIVNTHDYHMAAWKQFVEELGLKQWHYEVACNSFGRTNWDIFDEWFERRRELYDYDDLGMRKETLFRELIAGRERPRPGFIELMEAAKHQGIKIALATSGPKENAEFLLEDMKIRHYFDVLVWGDARILGKPHPQPFLKAAARLAVHPKNCIGFEDSLYGCLSVTRAGMKLVAISPSNALSLRLKRWTPFIFEDFTKISKLLPALCSPIQ